MQSLVSDGQSTTTYAYDSFDQLVREDNQAAGKTWTYAYDDGGNIQSKTEYAYTTGSLGAAVRTIPYGYGDASWSDLLTSIGGQSLTADEIGNLLSDGTWTYTWQHGRQLSEMSKSGTDITYSYDADGLRISKTVNGTTYHYYYLDSQLVEMTWDSNKLHFTYDSVGPASVNYNGTIYNYIKNAQGDIVGLVDFNGTKVVEYIYDAWGNHLSTFGTMASTLGKYNPLRYRGYVYDTETGLYHLQSRYYNPGWGRFINADSQLSTGGDLTGMNLFAYCGNNPVNRVDPSGEAWWHWALGALIVGACAAATVITCGGFAGAAMAIGMVSSRMAAATTAATVSAGAFIGSATAYGVAAITAASSSNTIKEFNDRGNWGTVAATASGGLLGGYSGYTVSKSQISSPNRGFETFGQLKKEIGSPGEGKEWHHIVEQCQMKKAVYRSNDSKYRKYHINQQRNTSCN